MVHGPVAGMNVRPVASIQTRRIDEARSFTYLLSRRATRMKSRAKYLVGFVLFAGAGMTVRAQTPPVAPPVLSGEGMMVRVGELSTQLEADAKHMRHLQAVARKEKDVIKLTCVNDTLVQLKAKQNLFDDSRRQFETNVGTDAEAARPAFNELSITSSDVSNLRAAAEACVGVPELYKQESDVSVQHPDFPDDPTLDDPFEPDLEPPAYASPFR
jgi:hypothetical protein